MTEPKISPVALELQERLSELLEMTRSHTLERSMVNAMITFWEYTQDAEDFDTCAKEVLGHLEKFPAIPFVVEKDDRVQVRLSGNDPTLGVNEGEER